MEKILNAILSSFLLALLGIILLTTVYKFFNFLFGINPVNELRNNNKSVAIFLIGIFLSISIIIAVTGLSKI